MTDPLQGKHIPAMSLPSSAGGDVHFPEAFKGKWTVLYFYPKDDTPGCTQQACAYRDNLSEFEKAGAQVFGVSLDSIASHHAFRDKFSLSFPLLSDADHKLSDALGAYGDQQWQGRTFKGLSRDTFLIDPAGTIRRVWRRVDPTTTMVETYDELQRLQDL